jgi:hypothetical protein
VIEKVKENARLPTDRCLLGPVGHVCEPRAERDTFPARLQQRQPVLNYPRMTRDQGDVMPDRKPMVG